MGTIRSGVGGLGLLFVSGLVLAADPAPNPPVGHCVAADQAKREIIDVVEKMYAALQLDSIDDFKAQVAAGYYAFDGGARFSAESLVALIKQLHGSGMKFEWTVTEPDVHVSCNQAWLTYVNRGSVENASGRTATTWLESAQLERVDGKWRIQFFHSTEVPIKP